MKALLCLLLIGFIQMNYSIGALPINNFQEDMKNLIQYMKDNNYLPTDNTVSITESDFFNIVKELTDAPKPLQNIVNLFISQINTYGPVLTELQCTIMNSLQVLIPCYSDILIIG